jgi:hypothetical protein
MAAVQARIAREQDSPSPVRNVPNDPPPVLLNSPPSGRISWNVNVTAHDNMTTAYSNADETLSEYWNRRRNLEPSVIGYVLAPRIPE